MKSLPQCCRKPTDLSIVSEVLQGPAETSMFLKRPIDPKIPENRRPVNIAFVTQLALHIKEKKLQRLEGFEEKISKFLEVAH